MSQTDGTNGPEPVIPRNSPEPAVAERITLRNRMHPTIVSKPSCIVIPRNVGNFELKPGFLSMLPKFHGSPTENPYNHLRDFRDHMLLLNFERITEDSLKLRVFPFSLLGNAHDWLYTLEENFVNTFEQLVKEFLKKYFLNHRTAKIRQSLDYDTRARVQSMCAGTFDEKTDTEAWTFLNDVADKTYQWQTMREEIPFHRANVYQVDSDSESATLRTILEKIENLETGKRERQPNTSFVNHAAMPNCVVCESSDHLVQDCPDVLSLREGRKDQANVMYQLPNNQHFNGGWNNNFNNSNSRGNRNYQGGSSGSAPYQPHNQVNQHQSSSTWQQNPSYQAPLNVPYVPPHNRNLPPPTTSLEDTLKAFMQVTQSSIAKLEGQIGQMETEISTRDKGTFSSQTQANPKGNTKHPRYSNRDGVNAIISLRSGTKVDNLVKMPKKPELESKPIEKAANLDTMRRELMARCIPGNYEEESFAKLVVLSETEAHRISRYKLGLTKRLQDELALFTAQSLSKVVEMAKRAETKLKPAAYSSYSAPAVGTTAATTTITAATLGEERLNQRLVWALYVALRARDVDRVHNLLAPDIEWWFHGPPLHQHMTPLLTGTSSSDKKVFTFLPSSITVFGSTVLVEGCSRDGLVSWIHAWKVNNGLITELREYFNTSLSVRRIENINQSSPSTSPSSVSSSSSSSSYCLPLWESRISDNIGKSVPGIVLALF
ncbi:hypothetical protein GIB67_012970 [Kingdonia uniflora]|uniref:Retrotransposon gag domain-containing protein n=1 Tax=Kingdonia uniflora TaxID=39325 RepID=A0A7J7LXX3_9MAGN|nr:hypothetical protein GIB67_012970 [Kingdonia uniflora]